MNCKQNEAYEKIEYFLRNNLDDDDFSEYEIALDTLIMETHPVKELTDEEMMEAEYEFMYWNRSLDKPLVEIAYELGVFKQAIAILRKAQEK